jgi:hypothetical protein
MDGVPIYGVLWHDGGASFRQKIYYYLEALIKAESINPQADYDGERYNELIEKIALSDLPYGKRHDLVQLLKSSIK